MMRDCSVLNFEKILGLNQKSFAEFNRCKSFEIKVYKMTDEDIATEMSGLQSGRQSGRQSDDVQRWRASQPVQGPSSGVEILGTPVVELYDISCFTAI